MTTTGSAPLDDRYADWDQEQWTYGGLRVSSKGKRMHQWIEPDGKTGLYSDKGSFVIGGLYDVRVQRDGGGGTTRTTPHYSGECVDSDKRAALEIKDRVARRQLAGLARERNDAAQSALDEALEPLLEIARSLRSGAEMEALVSYVTRKVYTPGRRTR